MEEEILKVIEMALKAERFFDNEIKSENQKEILEKIVTVLRTRIETLKNDKLKEYLGKYVFSQDFGGNELMLSHFYRLSERGAILYDGLRIISAVENNHVRFGTFRKKLTSGFFFDWRNFLRIHIEPENTFRVSIINAEKVTEHHSLNQPLTDSLEIDEFIYNELKEFFLKEILKNHKKRKTEI